MTVASSNPPTARADNGGDGTAEGVTGEDGPEAKPRPAAFVAVTVNVCTLPLVKPVISHDTAPAVVQDPPPGNATAV